MCWLMAKFLEEARYSARPIEKKEETAWFFLLGLTVRISFISPTSNRAVASNSMIKRILGIPYFRRN